MWSRGLIAMHERMVGLSGSSKPMYWKVRLWFGLGYDFFTMVRTRLNSDGVKGSSGCCWSLETGEKA
jgi:hypothetical protein